ARSPEVRGGPLTAVHRVGRGGTARDRQREEKPPKSTSDGIDLMTSRFSSWLLHSQFQPGQVPRNVAVERSQFRSRPSYPWQSSEQPSPSGSLPTCTRSEGA